MNLTVNGVATEMNMEGAFAITNNGSEDAAYVLVMVTPVGQSANPEVLENTNATLTGSVAEEGSYYYIFTATNDVKLVLDITEGANIIAEVLTYVEDSEWPATEQFELATPIEDENFNYTGWSVEENLTITLTAGQQLKIQIQGLTDWETWMTPAIDYTLTIVESVA